MLESLGYTRLWLNYEILTTDELAAQYMQFRSGEDTNTEHYRYSTLKQYLTTKQMLTDDELDAYLGLVTAEQDRAMAAAAAVDLIKLPKLTTSQFEQACKVLNSVEHRLTKLIDRWKLVQKLTDSQPNEKLFAECMLEGDQVVQERLVSLASATQLQHLIEFGITKKVRKLAVEKLRTRFS